MIDLATANAGYDLAAKLMKSFTKNGFGASLLAGFGVTKLVDKLKFPQVKRESPVIINIFSGNHDALEKILDRYLAPANYNHNDNGDGYALDTYRELP